MQIATLPGNAPILAYFGGYAPADRHVYELFVLAVDTATVRLTSLHSGVRPGARFDQIARDAAQGRPTHPDSLRDQPLSVQTDLLAGTLPQALAGLLRHALEACHRGVALRVSGQIIGGVRLYGFTLPELRGGSSQAPRLPDAIAVGVDPDHPQLWVPSTPLTRLPRRYHRRAAQKDHPLWNA